MSALLLSSYCAKEQRQTAHRGKSLLISSNQSRPHFSTYITARYIKQEGPVQLHEWLWNLPRAAKHEAFSGTQRGNGLQLFSLQARVHVLALTNLEIDWPCQSCK